MSTKMLINATRGGQLRVAVVDGTILQEYQVEIAEDGQTRGNIYRGVVANIQPSLNAAFVDLGEERHGFLPVGDVLPFAYHKQPAKSVRRPKIDQVLERGKPILVQVTKDGVGQKGPALSTNLALAGRYLVMTPFDGVRGISRKAEDDAARKKIRERLKKLELPENHGVIVRTNGLDQNQQTLNRDLNALLRLWKKVRDEAERGKGAKLVYSDQDLVMQALRDYLDPAIREVVVDEDVVFAKAEAFMKAFMPRSKTQLVRYEDRLPLFSRYRLETQIDRIYDRSASLPSGGGIVIDQTEALTAIDVNSGRATKTANHDESIFKVNCEAAREVARQLRLRDIGGLVVVDFIDMRLRKHQNRLERVMRDSMKIDNARHSVGRISPNGLLEINRQRIKQSLRLRTHRNCPACGGAGTTPTPEFAALRLLSRIEARAASGLVQSVTLALHPEIANALQNGFRQHLAAIEADHQVEIEVLSASSLGLTEERIEWVQREGGLPEAAQPKARLHSPVIAADLTPPERRRPQGADSAADEEPESEEETSSRPRRRRRRRRGRGGADGVAAAEERQQAAGAAAAAGEGAGEEGESSEQEAQEKPRRRRRRRGRRS
ncbi:MAG: Rne/Rng family ribonuclease, partial [Acidobacteriota bacterium]